MEQLIHRARAMLSILGETEVARVLMQDGIDAGEAFLTVKAAKLLEEED